MATRARRLTFRSRVRWPRWVGRLVGVAVLVGLTACGGDDDTPAGGSPGDGAGTIEGNIQVFAAASLTDAFEEIATAFEAGNPGVDVALSFAGSSSLVEQLLDGGPADVLATADERTMDELVDADATPAQGDPEVFARNQLVLAVPAGNPGEVSDLADLADDDLLVGLCAAEVPCGNVAADALDDAGVTPAVDTHEPDVRSLLTKLTAGELDAGLVYETDARAAGDDLEVVEAPELGGATTSYPIVPLDAGDNPDAGTAFVDFVLSDQGQTILADHGFASP